MKMTPDILRILRCPAGGDALVLAESELIERVNEAVAEGRVRDQLDVRVDLPLDAGLINTARDRLYPIRADIATLIAEQAIRVADFVAPSES